MVSRSQIPMCTRAQNECLSRPFSAQSLLIRLSMSYHLPTTSSICTKLVCIFWDHFCSFLHITAYTKVTYLPFRVATHQHPWCPPFLLGSLQVIIQVNKDMHWGESDVDAMLIFKTVLYVKVITAVPALLVSLHSPSLAENQIASTQDCEIRLRSTLRTTTLWHCPGSCLQSMRPQTAWQLLCCSREGWKRCWAGKRYGTVVFCIAC